MIDEENRQGNILPAVGTDDCFTCYANFGNIITTPFDVQIVFSDLLERDGNLVPHARARIIMAPEHAALLVRALAARLKVFVDTNGELRKIASAASTSKIAPAGDTVEVGGSDRSGE